MKKALVIVLAVALVFGFSTLAMADGHDSPTGNALEALDEAHGNNLWVDGDDYVEAAIDNKAVHIKETVSKQEFVGVD